jgi:hypothetical protein
MGLNVFALFTGFGVGSFLFSEALGAGFGTALIIFSGAELALAVAALRMFSGEISAGLQETAPRSAPASPAPRQD